MNCKSTFTLPGKLSRAYLLGKLRRKYVKMSLGGLHDEAELSLSRHGELDAFCTTIRRARNGPA